MDITEQYVTFVEDKEHQGCYFVWPVASKYDGAVGYISPNENGLIRFHPSVSYLYTPEMLDQLATFIRKLQNEGDIVKQHTARQLATYSAENVRRWEVFLNDGTTHIVWASTGDQAAALAEQKRQSDCGKNIKSTARRVL